MLERRYHALTGGRPFPKTTSTLKEVTRLAGLAPALGLGDAGDSGARCATFILGG